jgi:hypothetical protein
MIFVVPENLRGVMHASKFLRLPHDMSLELGIRLLLLVKTLLDQQIGT